MNTDAEVIKKYYQTVYQHIILYMRTKWDLSQEYKIVSTYKTKLM